MAQPRESGTGGRHLLTYSQSYLDKVRHWPRNTDIPPVILVRFDIIFYGLPSDSRIQKYINNSLHLARKYLTIILRNRAEYRRLILPNMANYIYRNISAYSKEGVLISKFFFQRNLTSFWLNLHMEKIYNIIHLNVIDINVFRFLNFLM